MASAAQPAVAVFVDLENVGAPALREVHTYASGLGRVCHLAVYANWRTGHTQSWKLLLELGGVPKQVLNGGGKNAADIAMAVDCIEYLYQSPTVEVFVLATGDSDFVALAQRLRSRGKVVYGVASSSSSVSQQLVGSCDGFWHLPAVVAEPAAATPVVANVGPSLQEVRDTLAAQLAEKSPQKASVLGSALRRVFPAFRPKQLGHPNLTALLEAQQDWLVLEKNEGREMLVRLVAPGPAGEAVSSADEPDAAEPPAKPARTRSRRRKGSETPHDETPAVASEPEPVESLLMRMQIPLPLLEPEPERNPEPGPEPKPEPEPGPGPDPEPKPEPARPKSDAGRKAAGAARRDWSAAIWTALQHGVLDAELEALGWSLLAGLDDDARNAQIRTALAEAGKPRTALSWLVQAANWLKGQKNADLHRRVQRSPDLVFDGVPGFGATRARRALVAWQRIVGA